MPKKKPTLEEILAKRGVAAIETPNGLGLVKASGAPASFRKDGVERSARFTMSTETPDRYRDIVRQSGIDTAEFTRNPIALWMHRHAEDPLGTWDDIKVVNGRPKRTEGTLKFAAEGDFDFVDKVAKYVEAGIYKACSIGFYIRDYELIMDDDDEYWTGGLDIIESELMECSVVAVGANPDALAKAADIDRAYVIEVLEDVLDNWTKTADGLIVPRAQFEEVYQEITAKTVSTPDLKEAAINAEPDPAELDDPSDEAVVREMTFTLDLDTEEAEKVVDGLTAKIERLLKKVGEATGITRSDPEPVYVENSIDLLDEAIAAADEKIAALDSAA